MDTKEAQNDLKKNRMLILKRTERSLFSAEAYLKKRNWEITTTTDLKKLVMLAYQLKPMYIFLAFDHVDHRVTGMSKVLSQIVKSFIIPYMETAYLSSVASARLVEAKYYLKPPMTGPKIERLINKITKDLGIEPREETDSPRPSFSYKKEASEKATAVSGGKLKVYGNFVYHDKRMSSKGMGAYEDEETEGWNPSLGSIFQYGSSQDIFTKQSSPTREEVREAIKSIADPTTLPDHFKRKAEESEVDYESRIFDFETNAFKKRREREEEDFWNDLTAYAYDAAEDRTNNPNVEVFDDEDIKNALLKMVDSGSIPLAVGIDPEKDFDSNFELIKKKFKARMARREQQHEQISKTDILLRGTKSSDKTNLGILEESSQQTLDEVYLTSKKKLVDNEITQATNVMCFEVNSSRFSGLLLAAIANTKKFDESLVSFLRKKLKEYLKKKGEELSESESMEIKLHEVDFTDWALKEAEFLRRSVYEGNEIALAFFPTESLNKALGKSKDAKMVSMELAEILSDTPVEFDLYIHLPVNDRYILYTKQGQIFYGDQKERLMARGVDRMHLLKKAEKDVKRYRVQNFLNSKIKLFKEKRQAS